jgi:hypothetical protein
VQAGASKTVDNFKRKRYLVPSNYVSDIVAGNITRTPIYAAFDHVFAGVTADMAMGSAEKSLAASACGWSLAYILGNSILSEVLGDFYHRNKKAVDAVYSSTMTFGFGMAMNLWAGYDMKQALVASTMRAALAFPLGPFTRFASDAFREVRGEPSITPDGANMHNQPARYTTPRLAATAGLPLALMFGTFAVTPDKEPTTQEHVPLQRTDEQQKAPFTISYLA